MSQTSTPAVYRSHDAAHPWPPPAAPAAEDVTSRAAEDPDDALTVDIERADMLATQLVEQLARIRVKAKALLDASHA
jgi:hypothetical protein